MQGRSMLAFIFIAAIAFSDAVNIPAQLIRAESDGKNHAEKRSNSEKKQRSHVQDGSDEIVGMAPAETNHASSFAAERNRNDDEPETTETTEAPEGTEQSDDGGGDASSSGDGSGGEDGAAPASALSRGSKPYGSKHGHGRGPPKDSQGGPNPPPLKSHKGEDGDEANVPHRVSTEPTEAPETEAPEPDATDATDATGEATTEAPSSDEEKPEELIVTSGKSVDEANVPHRVSTRKAEDDGDDANGGDEGSTTEPESEGPTEGSTEEPKDPEGSEPSLVATRGEPVDKELKIDSKPEKPAKIVDKDKKTAKIQEHDYGKSGNTVQNGDQEGGSVRLIPDDA